ncbi:hypothetical protein Bca101_082470 [Brassica carinata]
MEDERVDLLLNRIRGKFDWSNTEWPVLEHEESEMEEAHKKDIGSEADKSVDNTKFVSEEETSSVKVAGKGKRKIHDEGAETRKKKLLCKRSAEKNLILGPETKSFIEGLIHTSVTYLGVMLSTQMANMERMLMERMLMERMGKMESEVSQLRGAIRLSGEGSDPSKSEAEQDPLNIKGDQAPPKSLSDQAPPKSKGNQPKGAKKAGKKIAVETNDFDFGLSTQDVRDLSQATFVDDFDLSQVKVENLKKSRPFNMSTRHLVDDTRGTAAETAPDAALVFLGEEDWEKVTEWSTSSIPLCCGPIVLDDEIAKRRMDPY